MADIRIKDLTTPASSTASDDFFAVDGTTHGTRKLSAFSPTFGGNATVTGTLTVNGAASDLTNSNNGQTGFTVTNSNGGTSAFTKLGTWNGTVGVNLVTWGSAYTGRTNESWLYTNGLYPLKFGTDSTARMTLASTGELSISATTASTTTSSGALVVGNGTSGGLGVGGAINCGGNIVLSPASVAASGEVGNLRIADSSNTNRKLFFGLDNTVSPNGVGYIQSTLTGTTTIPLQLQPLGGSLSVGNSGTVVTLNGTTASTTTTSGALVVSGGVGVAGAINAGDQIKSERTSGTDTASAVLGVLTTTGAGVTNSFGIDARVIVNNSSGTTTSATGLRALSRVSNVSTVTQAVAMLAQVDNPGGGTITTAYGLYVNPITAGGTNYAIYTGGGRINFQSLPTSSAGLAAGTIWNDGGTLKVA